MGPQLKLSLEFTVTDQCIPVTASGRMTFKGLGKFEKFEKFSERMRSRGFQKFSGTQGHELQIWNLEFLHSLWLRAVLSISFCGFYTFSMCTLISEAQH